MNTSIQDAANLGWKLAVTVRGWTPDGLLDTCHTERHPVGRQVLRTSGALRIGLTGPPALAGPPLAGCRRGQDLSVADRMVGAISGLSIACPAPAGAHPLPGKRAEDLPLAGGRRLDQALNSGCFLPAAGTDGALLPVAPSGDQDRVDTASVVHPSGTAVLIRPDAYIAWAAGPALAARRTPQIRTALAAWCGNPGPALCRGGGEQLRRG